MTGFILALVAAFLTGFGAGDQILLAQLSAATGPRPALLITAIATTSAAAFLAACAASEATRQFGPTMRLSLGILAVVLAGGRLLMPVRGQPPKEPTHSLGATAIVLFAREIADASRLLILSIALSYPAHQTGLGGALGGAAALVIGWSSRRRARRLFPGIRRARQACGVLMLVVPAVWILIDFNNH